MTAAKLDAYNELLDCLGISSEGIESQFKHSETNKNKEKLKKIRENLQAISSLAEFNDNISKQALIHWIKILAEINQIDDVDQYLFNLPYRTFNWSVEKTNKYMSWVYLGLNFFGFLVALGTQPEFSFLKLLDNDLLNTSLASSWNYFDTLGGVLTGVQQILQGEPELGVVNLLASFQLVACTIIANIAKFTPLIHISSAAMSALMGFSFAFCMMVSACTELYEAAQCNKRIKYLQDNLQLFPSSDSIDIILIEMAQRENHYRSALSWSACTVAMTAVAIVSYIGLSALSGGALPAATIIVTAAAVISGCIRKYWVGQVDYVQQLKDELQDPSATRMYKLYNQVNQLCLNINEKALKQALPSSHSFFNPKDPKKYLMDMIVSDPERLEKLLPEIKTAFRLS